MAWPPTGASGTNFTAYGDATVLFWGTEDQFESYIVRSTREAEIVEKVPLENGSGVQVGRWLITSGRTYEITVLDRTDTTPPAIGELINLVDFVNGATGGSKSFRVVDRNASSALKAPGERVIMAEALFAITDEF